MGPDDYPFHTDEDALKSMLRALAEKAARAEALERDVGVLKARHTDTEWQIQALLQALISFDRARFGRRPERPWGRWQD